jgi:hypothetical protein
MPGLVKILPVSKQSFLPANRPGKKPYNFKGAVIMANTLNRVCPFSHRGCAECSFYIGRHNFTNFSDTHKCSAPDKKPNFDHIFLQLSGKTPNAIKDAEDEMPDIVVKVINKPTKQTRAMNMLEAAQVDWRNAQPKMLINGRLQINSWGQLLEYCRKRAAKGETEIVIHDSAPEPQAGSK